MEEQEKAKQVSLPEKSKARFEFLETMKTLSQQEVAADVNPQQPEKSEYYHIFKKLSWCPSSGCPGAFRYKNDRHYKCEMCILEYCLDCRTPFHADSKHDGYDCHIYQQKIARDRNRPYRPVPKFKLGDKFRQCPIC